MYKYEYIKYTYKELKIYRYVCQLKKLGYKTKNTKVLQYLKIKNTNKKYSISTWTYLQPWPFKYIYYHPIEYTAFNSLDSSDLTDCQ